MTFFSNEAELKPTIKLQGNSTLADSFWDYTYDQNNRLTSTHAQYGKAGDETDYYAYNPEGVVAFVLNREMGDYLNDAYTNYFYDEKKPKQLLKTVRLDRERPSD